MFRRWDRLNDDAKIPLAVIQRTISVVDLDPELDVAVPTLY
jgi:hypothetical protein